MHHIELNMHHMDRKQDRAESNQPKLGNKSVTLIKHKRKIQSNTG
jgi:hypothetical protein